MSVPNEDQVDGKVDRAEGWIKEKVGEVTGDRELEAEGEVQNAEGNAQETWGNFKHGLGDAVDAVGDAVKNAGDKISK